MEEEIVYVTFKRDSFFSPKQWVQKSNWRDDSEKAAQRINRAGGYAWVEALTRRQADRL